MPEPIAVTDPPLLAQMVLLALACVLGLTGLNLIDRGLGTIRQRSNPDQLAGGVVVILVAALLAADGWQSWLLNWFH